MHKVYFNLFQHQNFRVYRQMMRKSVKAARKDVIHPVCIVSKVARFQSQAQQQSKIFTGHCREGRTLPWADHTELSWPDIGIATCDCNPNI
jgi:hypothetical protein